MSDLNAFQTNKNFSINVRAIQKVKTFLIILTLRNGVRTQKVIIISHICF